MAIALQAMGDYRLIEWARVGVRMLTWLPCECGYGASQMAVDQGISPLTHRAVWLSQEWGDGCRLEVGLLRSLGWLAERAIGAVGDTVAIELPEMGAEGELRVVAIRECPLIEDGPGRIVTGVFRFSRGSVYNLFVEGEPSPIGVTVGHPFWSVDRRDWVPVEQLLEGERLATLDGRTTTVRKWEYRGEEPVYNLEVDADHCYRVGEQGILVHNASGPKAQFTHTSGESTGLRTCINLANVNYYFSNQSGDKVLQIAAGSNVYKGALALDIKPYDGYTAVMMLTSETYDNVIWFTNPPRQFDKVVVINPLSDNKQDDYSWIFSNAKSVLKSGKRLELTSSSPGQAIRELLKERGKKQLVEWLEQGFVLEFGRIPDNVRDVLQKTADENVLVLPVETTDDKYVKFFVNELKGTLLNGVATLVRKEEQAVPPHVLKGNFDDRTISFVRK